MIVFIYGTTAEAIKIAPVARRLAARGVPYESWLTCQHTTSLLEIIPTLGLRPPARIIANGRSGEPLRTPWDVVRWLGVVAWWRARNLRRIRRTLPAKSIVVVQGDTLTTVLGAQIARRLRIPCAHIEAGLRSGDWRHPFPEELDRRLAGRLATIHYTPSEEAAANLASRGNVVHTHGNTAIDAVLDHELSRSESVEPFGIVLLHRFEFVANPHLVQETFGTLASESPVPLRVVVDAFSGHGLEEALVAHGSDRLVAVPKLPHEAFIRALGTAEFVITDSGGIQAEAALVGVPTLIHRKTTEQTVGLGENIVLSEWSVDRLSAFLRDFQGYRREPKRPEHSPSDIIVADLAARGFAS